MIKGNNQLKCQKSKKEHYKQGGTDFKSDQHFFGPFLKYEKHTILESTHHNKWISLY